MSTVSDRYDPQARYRGKASTLIDEAESLLSRTSMRGIEPGDEWRVTSMIDAAAVAIAIADHYQRESQVPA